MNTAAVSTIRGINSTHNYIGRNAAPQATIVGGLVQVLHNIGQHSHAHSTGTNGLPALSVMTVNVLYQTFYDKCCKNLDLFPLQRRLRILHSFVTDHIIRQRVDVVFFQEYSAVDMSSVTTHLSKHGYCVEMPGDATLFNGCAVAFLQSRFTFVSSQALPFDFLTDNSSRGGSRRRPTGKEVTIVKLRHHGSSDAIVFGSMHVPFEKNATKITEILHRGLEDVLLNNAENRVILGGDFARDILPQDGVSGYAHMMNLSVFSPPESTCRKQDSTFAKYDHFLARGFAPPPSSNSGFRFHPSCVSDLLPHSAQDVTPSADRAFFSDHRAVLVTMQMI